MKLPLAPAVLLAALCLGACAPVGVDIARDLPAQTIPGDPAAHAAALSLSEVGANPPMSFASDTAPIDGSVASGIYLRSAALTIDTTADPAGTASCWDFVTSVTVYIESTAADSTLPRVRVAAASAPGCVQVLDLAPESSLDLKPYTDTGFRIVTEAAGLPPDHNVTFTTHLVLRASVL